MDTKALEVKIRDAIENAIGEYEIDYGEITNVEIEANVFINPDGDNYVVNVYDGD